MAPKCRYLCFAWRAWKRVVTERPAWVYLSEPLSCPAALPLLLVPKLRLVYHEHDLLRFAPGAFAWLIRWSRRRVIRRAQACVFPNQDRAVHGLQDLEPRGRIMTAWNCPTREEVLEGPPHDAHGAFWLLYQGSIVPPRLPLTLLEALKQLPERVKLRVMGYETIGHRGYREAFREKARALGLLTRVQMDETLLTRAELLARGSSADVGISFMPMRSEDANMRAMIGASNKAYDYLACGLALLVSDLPEWRQAFVEPGFAQACDPDDPGSIAAAVLRWLDAPAARAAAVQRGQEKILAEWNYDRQFEPVLQFLEENPGTGPAGRLLAWLQRLPAGMKGKARLARRLLGKRLDAADVRVSDRWGCHYVVPSLREPIAFHLLIDRAYESPGLELLFKRLRPGQIFVDVGANVGVYTLPVARHLGSQGKVVAIEASPRIAAYLQRNVEMNALGNVLVHSGAAWGHAGSIAFYEAPAQHFGMGSVLPQFGAVPVQVPTFRLDDLLAEKGIKAVHAIKLDVEGAEAAALEGACRCLEEFGPLVLFERNASRTSGEDAEVLLRNLGYRVQRLADFLAGRSEGRRPRAALEMLVGVKPT